ASRATRALTEFVLGLESDTVLLVAGTGNRTGRHADVAQLVEHHLAKVRVAGSNPVVRSERSGNQLRPHSVEWPRGEATACKAVYTGSNPVSTSVSDSSETHLRAISSAGERFPDTEEATGSIPVSPTAGQRDVNHLWP